VHKILVIAAPLVLIAGVLWLLRRSLLGRLKRLLVFLVLAMAAYMLWLAMHFSWGSQGGGGGSASAGGGGLRDGPSALADTGPSKGAERLLLDLRYDGRSQLAVEGGVPPRRLFAVSVRSQEWAREFRGSLERLRASAGAQCVLRYDDAEPVLPVPAWNALQEIVQSCGCILVHRVEPATQEG
jgi:hypothetical protein